MARAPREGWSERHQKLAQESGRESWEAWCEALEAEREHTICGAMRKRLGTPCLAHPAGENGRCYHHGANTPVGPMAPGFIHGRKSKYLPRHILDDYEKALKDPDLISLNEQMALLDAREAELLRQLGNDGAGARAWSEVSNWFGKFEKAYRAGDGGKMVTALGQLKIALDAGVRYTGVWRELREIALTKNRLAATERKRIEAAQNFITLEKLDTIIAYLADSVRRHVKEGIEPRVSRTRISADLRALLRNPLPDRDGLPVGQQDT